MSQLLLFVALAGGGLAYYLILIDPHLIRRPGLQEKRADNAEAERKQQETNRGRKSGFGRR